MGGNFYKPNSGNRWQEQPNFEHQNFWWMFLGKNIHLVKKRSKKFRGSLRSPLGRLASIVAPLLATLPQIKGSKSKHFFHRKRGRKKIPTCCNVMWWARSFAQNPLKHDPTSIMGGDREGSAGAWRLIEFCEVPVRPLSVTLCFQVQHVSNSWSIAWG